MSKENPTKLIVAAIGVTFSVNDNVVFVRNEAGVAQEAWMSKADIAANDIKPGKILFVDEISTFKVETSYVNDAGDTIAKKPTQRILLGGTVRIEASEQVPMSGLTFVNNS